MQQMEKKKNLTFGLSLEKSKQRALISKLKVEEKISGRTVPKWQASPCVFATISNQKSPLSKCATSSKSHRSCSCNWLPLRGHDPVLSRHQNGVRTNWSNWRNGIFWLKSTAPEKNKLEHLELKSKAAASQCIFDSLSGKRSAEAARRPTRLRVRQETRPFDSISKTAAVDICASS